MIVPSRLGPRGGQAFLIETLAAMKDLAFTCLLLGDEAINPAHRSELEQRIVKLGLDDRVRFAGFCDDMPAAYKLADVVVSAALVPPPFDRVAVEAQAMGRPLVVADHGGTREVVIPETTALPFTPGNADSLENKLRQALGLSAAARTAMGNAARTHVTAHYTLDHLCAKTLELYAREDDAAIKS
jgi:glycosyltransferase involved in cell wall biosynthesis